MIGLTNDLLLRKDSFPFYGARIRSQKPALANWVAGNNGRRHCHLYSIPYLCATSLGFVNWIDLAYIWRPIRYGELRTTTERCLDFFCSGVILWVEVLATRVFIFFVNIKYHAIIAWELIDTYLLIWNKNEEICFVLFLNYRKLQLTYLSKLLQSIYLQHFFVLSFMKSIFSITITTGNTITMTAMSRTLRIDQQDNAYNFSCAVMQFIDSERHHALMRNDNPPRRELIFWHSGPGIHTHNSTIDNFIQHNNGIIEYTGREEYWRK